MKATSSARLLLASASPRRRELLTQIGVDFGLATHGVDETRYAGEATNAYALRMAREKARDVAAGCAVDQAVLGADTVVVLDGEALGKPRDREHALEMLMALSGRTHHVCSAVAVCRGGDTKTAVSVTEVTFRQLCDREVRAYWSTGEPCDKAGAYGIQGVGALFVTGINGSYSGVVGLPLLETAQLLAAFGVSTALSGNAGGEDE